ncbi:Clavaminate synthase-like protein [Xylaria telfairii]|nr:Clavaminate synthase-like protein [Xylaria telfairii]
MPVPAIIIGRPLRLVPRNMLKASKQGLPPLRQSSQFDEFIKLDEIPSVPSGEMKKRRSRKASRPAGEKPKKRDHYWQSDLQANNCRISYYRNVSAGPLVLSRAFLRDACTCEKCVDPSSGQKNFASADVPLFLDIKSLTITDGGELLVCWMNDFHTGGLHYSQYPPGLWDRAESVPIEPIPEPRLWGHQVMSESAPYFRHKSFMEDGPDYRRAMTAFSYFGLLFLRDVPWSEESIKGIASRLGVIQDTFYGTTWDVKSKPNAENVAYTNSYLGLHQDLLYMGNVPRVQILHCLQNTCAGGESIFSDGYLAAHKYRLKYPNKVDCLMNRKVVYHYNKNGHIYRSERPVLSDLGSSRLGVYWSPPFQSPVQMDEPTPESMGKYKEWHKASRRMKEILEHHESVFEYKMKPDECVIFDNRRVFHGRRAFDTSSGERWLKGTYVENDSFNSKIRSLKLVSDPVSIIPKPVR